MGSKGFIMLIGVLMILLVAHAGASQAVQPKGTDEIGNQIEERGKSIDVVSSSIEKSTESMEDDIEKAGKEIDSPEAEKRIEIAGQDIDKLSDKMDKETEEQGKLIEEATRTVDASEGSTLNADKHEKLQKAPQSNPGKTRIGEFEKQEKIRQKLEDLVDREGERVERIGDSMRSRRRDFIPHNKKRKEIKYLKHKSRRKLKNSRRKKPKKELKSRHLKKLLNRKMITKNATKRRVIIPVKKKKLEKLMLYYYVLKKMKEGELSARNLESFFAKFKDYADADVEKEEPKKAIVDIDKIIEGFGKKIKIEEQARKAEEDSRQPDISRLVELMGRLIKKSEPKKEEIVTTSNAADLKPLVKTSIDGARNEQENGVLDSGVEESASLQDLKTQEKPEHQTAKSERADFTAKQVRKMLKSISDINATLLGDNGERKERPHKEKTAKKCEGTECAGREIISLLDKAMQAVREDNKASHEPIMPFDKMPDIVSKVRGESRSKSDPYAGIGFTTDQEGNRNTNAGPGDAETNSDVQGTSRHIDGHGVDVVGTSDRILHRSIHDHHEDDDEDDDDEDDEDDDDDHDGFIMHGYHYPLATHPHHHGHYHVHHMYRGNPLPIRTGHHLHEEGYPAPLNVDTAPMGHYPNRHMHDHIDVDTMLRGHPYAHHHHTPEVSLEGPISLAPVYDDMHHMLNGPGIHDQTDVHYEVEMHAHPDHGLYHHRDDHHDNDHHGDYGHHDDDYDHYDDDHHDDNEYRHEDDHQHGINGDKRHMIGASKLKKHWRNHVTKTNSTHNRNKAKKDVRKESKLRRSASDDNDDEDDDGEDTVEEVPRNGHGVSRLSHLTEVIGNDMQHAINNRILDVEDVGRSIEEKVQHGVNKVTDISNNEVEAPDYDTEGHMDPNIHREDIEYSDDD